MVEARLSAGGAPVGAHAWRPHWRAVVPPVVAIGAASLVVAAGWRGADWPAQIFRIETFRVDGFTFWNNHWYGGHHSLGYSVLLPPLGATVGTTPVALVSVAVAAWAMWDLLRRVRDDAVAALVGSSLFAVIVAANVAIGRLPFLVGLAVALVALSAWARGATVVAAVLAVVSGLASPVSALFLGIVAGGSAMAHWRSARDLLRIGDVRGQGPLLAVLAMSPVLVIAWLFPSGGSFPFTVRGLAASLAATVAVAWVSTPEDREIRGVCAVTVVALMAAFVLQTPLGGNIVRFPMFAALPLLAVLLWTDRRRLLLVAVPLLVAWAWVPAADAIVWAGDDPSASRSFFLPMVAIISQEAGGPARVEIPFTRRHWEAAYVAPYLPLARGWERQLDRRTNPVFYRDEPLTALDLQVWLRENAVRYVALPEVELDPSAEEEAALLRQGQPFLRPVWESDDWKVWEVTNGESLVRGDAELVELAADSVTLDVATAGDVLVRVRYSPHWAVEGDTCVIEDPDGWTLLHVTEPGEVTMSISPDALVGVGDEAADRCDDEVVEAVLAGLPGPRRPAP